MGGRDSHESVRLQGARGQHRRAHAGGLGCGGFSLGCLRRSMPSSRAMARSRSCSAQPRHVVAQARCSSCSACWARLCALGGAAGLCAEPVHLSGAPRSRSLRVYLLVGVLCMGHLAGELVDSQAGILRSMARTRTARPSCALVERVLARPRGRRLCRVVHVMLRSRSVYAAFTREEG